jgi:prevent-host-death family protein
MKSVSISEFRKQVQELLKHVPAEGLLITKRGKPLAKVTPAGVGDWIGSMKGKLRIKGDIFSTGIRWEAERGLIDGKPLAASPRRARHEP